MVHLRQEQVFYNCSDWAYNCIDWLDKVIGELGGALRYGVDFIGNADEH